MRHFHRHYCNAGVVVSSQGWATRGQRIERPSVRTRRPPWRSSFLSGHLDPSSYYCVGMEEVKAAKKKQKQAPPFLDFVTLSYEKPLRTPTQKDLMIMASKCVKLLRSRHVPSPIPDLAPNLWTKRGAGWKLDSNPGSGGEGKGNGEGWGGVEEGTRPPQDPWQHLGYPRVVQGAPGTQCMRSPKDPPLDSQRCPN